MKVNLKSNLWVVLLMSGVLYVNDVYADISPFELKVNIEGGKDVVIHGGFLGLSVVNEYKGFDIVDQYWSEDNHGTRVCHVDCKGEGVARCMAFIDGKEMFFCLDESVDMHLVNAVIKNLISLFESVISDDTLNYKTNRQLRVKNNDGQDSKMIFTADYNFVNKDFGEIRIVVEIVPIK